MSQKKSWLKSLLYEDPRKTSRHKTPPLVAYFWDGGQPVAHPVQNISTTGFYLATDARWLLGTLIMMTLQRTRGDRDQVECSVIVMSKVVRYGEDGVGFAFIPVETATPGQKPGPGSHAADRKTLDKFLELVGSDAGFACFGCIPFLLPLVLLTAVHGITEIALGMGLLLMAIVAQTKFTAAAPARPSVNSPTRQQ
jgi:hypothetical protein